MSSTAHQGDPANRNSANVRLLTVKEAAQRTQVSARKLGRMIKAGELPVKRFGKAIRIHPKDLGL